jgi:hypothetical protein
MRRLVAIGRRMKISEMFIELSTEAARKPLLTEAARKPPAG